MFFKVIDGLLEDSFYQILRFFTLIIFGIVCVVAFVVLMTREVLNERKLKNTE